MNLTPLLPYSLFYCFNNVIKKTTRERKDGYKKIDITIFCGGCHERCDSHERISRWGQQETLDAPPIECESRGVLSTARQVFEWQSRIVYQSEMGTEIEKQEIRVCSNPEKEQVTEPQHIYEETVGPGRFVRGVFHSADDDLERMKALREKPNGDILTRNLNGAIFSHRRFTTHPDIDKVRDDRRRMIYEKQHRIPPILRGASGQKFGI